MKSRTYRTKRSTRRTRRRSIRRTNRTYRKYKGGSNIPVATSKEEPVRNETIVPIKKTLFKRFSNSAKYLYGQLPKLPKLSKLPKLHNIFKHLGFNKQKEHDIKEAAKEAAKEAIDEAANEADSSNDVRVLDIENMSFDEMNDKQMTLKEMTDEIKKNHESITKMINQFNQYAVSESIERLKKYRGANKVNPNMSANNVQHMNSDNNVVIDPNKVKQTIREFIQPLANSINTTKHIVKQSNQLKHEPDLKKRLKQSRYLLNEMTTNSNQCYDELNNILQKQDEIFNSWNEYLTRGAISTGKGAIYTGRILLGVVGDAILLAVAIGVIISVLLLVAGAATIGGPLALLVAAVLAAHS